MIKFIYSFLFFLLAGSVFCQIKIKDTINLKSVQVTNNVKHSKSWYSFKKQYIEKINTLSNKLDELQSVLKNNNNNEINNNQFTNKLMILNQQNQSLINRLNSYEKDKPNWFIFKRQFLDDFKKIQDDYSKLSTTRNF